MYLDNVTPALRVEGLYIFCMSKEKTINLFVWLLVISFQPIKCRVLSQLVTYFGAAIGNQWRLLFSLPEKGTKCLESWEIKGLGLYDFKLKKYFLPSFLEWKYKNSYSCEWKERWTCDVCFLFLVSFTNHCMKN